MWCSFRLAKDYPIIGADISGASIHQMSFEVASELDSDHDSYSREWTTPPTWATPQEVHPTIAML
jgi:hypothetical protein